MEKNFKTKFNNSQNTFSKIKFHKSSNNFEAKIEMNSTPSEDILYDEVIIYDGGGVDGYGD